MEKLLAVVEELHLINTRFDLTQVKRVWELYRQYVNPYATDGGFSLTLEEIHFVIELPQDQVDAYFDRMKMKTSTNNRDQMDMLELLATFTLLSQGRLYDKCKFLFTLLDFDVEDEIDMEELSLLITVVCEGMHKLCVLPQVPSFDAITRMSLDGFRSCGVESGSKMNFNQFVDWCTFHKNPQSLLCRLTCAYRVRNLIHDLHGLVNRQANPYYTYQLTLLSSTKATTHLIGGPAVGKPSSRHELSPIQTHIPLVTFYAFTRDISHPKNKRNTDTMSANMVLVESQTIEVVANQPYIVQFKKLAPKTKYVLALTGVAQSDAKSNIVCITTFASETNSCRLVQLNHLGKPLIPSRDQKAIDSARETVSVAEASATILVHWNFGVLQPEIVLNALKLLQIANSEELVVASLVNHFRLLWRNNLHMGFARTVSNLVLTSWQQMLYGSFGDRHILQRDAFPSSTRTWMEDQFQTLWHRYVGALFQPDAIIEDINIYSFGATTLLRLPDSMEKAQYTGLGRILHEAQCLACIVCLSSPLFPITPPEDTTKAMMLIEYLNKWNLRSATSKLVVVAPTNDYGVISTISLADTTSTFTQILFGPFRPQNHSINAEAKSYAVGKFAVRHSQVYCEPHAGCLDIVIQRIKDQDGAIAKACCKSINNSRPQILLGPVVGIVTSKSAKLLIEADRDCVIVCEAKDRITFASYFCTRKVRGEMPTIFDFENLQPRRRYDIIFHGADCTLSSSFHTLQENTPALHLTWVANDDIYSLKAFNRVTTFWNDYLLNMTAFPSTDLVLCLHRHIAAQSCMQSAMTHWALHPNDKDAVVALFRQAIRQHWRINGAVLSSASHCFLGSGFDWNQLNIPISRDVVLWARQVALEYQRHGLWPELHPVDRYGYHLQNNIGFLHLDTMEHRLNTDEDFLVNKPEFLSPKQWALIENIFSQTNGANCLVLTCDVPFVWGSMRSPKNLMLWNEWGMYPKELEKLLLLAFSWKEAMPNRNVVLVCAGQIGANTTISRNSVTIEQIVVGPVTCGVPNEVDLPESQGASPTNAFTYSHTFQMGPLYTSTIVVPHPQQAHVKTHSFRHQQNNAKIILGPVLGRITATAARILIEVNRNVEQCVCICTKTNTGECVKSSLNLKAFLPSVFTLVDLKPQTEYIVSFEGLLSSATARFWTPHSNPFAVRCLVVHDSTWQNITDNSSIWHDILSSRAITAATAAETSYLAGDTLGGDSNLWRGIDATQASAPLQKPIAIVHNGGQVNMRLAFTEKELIALVHRMLDMDENQWESLTSEIQFAMQEAYRVQWNMPPFNSVLRECSNIMLFHEKDLYFSFSIVETRLRDDIDVAKATRAMAFFREIAQKVWFLYQNQLSTDLNPEALLTTRTSSFVSYGLCTIIALNQNFSAVAKEAPTSKSAGIDLTKVTQANNLLPPGSWLVLDDALMYMKQESKVLFASLCFDVLELALNPIYLIGINRFFEKIFDWKNQALDQRELHLVTLGQTCATYTITDQRSGGICHLYQLVSISALSTTSASPLYPASGSISKRFLYEKQGVSPTESTRSYLMVNILSDLSRVKCEAIPFHSPCALPCKAIVGPILGRLQVFKDALTEKTTVTCTILLEVDASCPITCVIIDVLSGREVKLTIEMKANVPERFVCTSLEPERRYAYHFEATQYYHTLGLENSQKRKGAFHTPSANINALNVVVVSSNFPQLRDKACGNIWQLLLERVKTPWHGIDLLLHVGGQVPLHQAAYECMLWLKEKFSASPSTHKEDVIQQMRAKIIQRFQQEYRVAWNVPFVCEVLSNTSNLMVWTQTDIATTYGRATDMLLKAGFTECDLEAAKIIQEIAIEVCLMYQSALGWTDDLEQEYDQPDEKSSLTRAPPRYYGLVFDYIGFFVFDMRSTKVGEEMTCNKRLTKPLNPSDRPTISEAQWHAFETLLRKKSIRALVLVMEYPLLLTNSKLSPLESPPQFYNSFDMLIHWIACPALLEQLIALLFKWKEKFDGREVTIISGNMSIGLNTLLRDVKTSFLIHTFATGPVIGNVNNFPFNDRGAFGAEKQYEFEHRFVPRLPNYILLEISIQTETMNDTEARQYATCMSDIMHQENIHVLHKPNRLQRLPGWWRRYCIQEKRTFWSNIVVKAVDERFALIKYLAEDKPYLNATKKWYAKYNFVDTTRLVELQSNMNSKTMFNNIKQVARDLWSILPWSIKEECAVLSDKFVIDLALEQVQFNPSGPIDLERFRSLCAAIAKAACALKVAAKLATEDAEMAYEAQQTQKRERLLVEAQEKQRQEAAAAQDVVQMEALQKSNILAYAEEMNRREKAKLDKAEADKEAALAVKKALKEALKRHNHDDEQQIHKEQRQLKALKERMEAHMAELGQTQEYNEMELEWSRRLREHQLHQQRRNESKYRASSKKNKANKDTS